MSTTQSILDRKGTSVATIDRNVTVLDAAKLMNERRIGALVVTSNDKVVGIFTERDVLNRIVAAGKDPKTTKVESVMTSPMACCKRDTALAECRTVMTNKRIRHLPVVEDGKLFGMISSGDILAGEVADQQQTIEYLHEYLYAHR
ncbi:MAG: CBS domain-containing protein [Planctomycetota bacterium]